MENIILKILAGFIEWIIVQIYTVERYKVSDKVKSRNALENLCLLSNCKVAKTLYTSMAIVIFLTCLVAGVTVTYQPNPIILGHELYSKIWGIAIVSLSSVPVWKMVQIAFE